MFLKEQIRYKFLTKFLTFVIVLSENTEVEMGQATMPTILAVDDEITCLEIIKFSLSSRGYNVLTVEGGAEAIEFLKRNEQKIDLILLDMMMPQMSGIVTLEQIRLIDSARLIPVVFQTGTAYYKSMNQEQEKGTINYIIRKPYKRDDLIKVVNTALKENAQNIE